MRSLLLLVACIGFAAAHVKYDGAQVFEVTPTTDAHISLLIAMRHSYDYWTEIRGLNDPVNIMATKSQTTELKRTLLSAEMSYKITIADVHPVLEKARQENEEALAKASRDVKAITWDAYYNYDDIMAWCDEMATNYPALVTVTDVGNSYEGRTMKVVKVSTGGSDKPAMFIDGGLHAREWVSPATVTFIINELVTNSATYQSSLDVVDFYFMPVANPDGYSYTWTDDRLWRKTRSPNEGGTRNCSGTDANRNWDFQWGVSGSSNFTCSDTYMGATPFSEVETQILRDEMIKSQGGNDLTKLYLTFHSYSQLILYPWGYTADEAPADEADLISLANEFYGAIYGVYGTNYTVESASGLYPASGASDDYAKAILNIKYVYNIELRPDSSNPGFELPPSLIVPTGTENFAGFQVMFEFIRDTYGAAVAK